MDTQEVLQVYAHVNGTDDEVLNTKLCGFKRITVTAGETKKVDITINAKAFATVNDAGKTGVTGNSADLYVGFGQPDERTEVLTGKKSSKISLK